ncbi:MAG TPA: hypothetical protein VNX68_18020 [Nitrosopumilaceae archaeon]|jgi:hypothetical protein|nr:hypothetical protein [Nitrosopumilaceae archaeon]
MTPEEYKNRLKAIDEERDVKKRQLVKECALSNNTVKIDDIVTDHIGSVKVESIKFDYNHGGIPCCIYYGIELKKDLTPTKKGEKRGVWQNNIGLKQS